jgi:hypothetical protein
VEEKKAEVSDKNGDIHKIEDKDLKEESKGNDLISKLKDVEDFDIDDI